MVLSIIIPVRNEIKYIKKTFDSIVQSSIGIQCQIIFVDGISTDGTYQWLKTKVKEFEYCSVIKNKKKFVNFGFNLAYSKARGKYIARLDGHSVYPKNYFKNAIAILDSDKNISIVGGPALHKGISWKGQTIANCMMNIFGVGDSKFRTSNSKMYVDTVPFAFYRKIVFEDVGLYSEKLVRNQDDEFNYRCRSRGYKILMHPKLKTEYYVRENLNDLIQQYYFYGFYKPEVFKMVPNGRRWHHYVPALFIIHIPIVLFLAKNNIFFMASIFIYFTLCVIQSIKCQKGFMMKVYSIVVFPCLHFSYGIGFLMGILGFYKLKEVK